MNDTLRHRGPDDEGFIFFSDQEIVQAYGRDTPEAVKERLGSSAQPINTVDESLPFGMGHRRLNIIDTSAAGHQPMTDETGKLWVVFNGEIYNFQQIKHELSIAGYQFISGTDTEILLAAYKHWGVRMPRYLNGMWAFVLYDAEKQILFGARDRFGVKPFYYFLDDHHFAFASEQKALLTLPFINKAINKAALYEYLTEGIVEKSKQGLFEHILELQPSMAFIFSLTENTLNEWQYYTLNYEEQIRPFSHRRNKKYKSKIKQLVQQAVKAHLQADVSIGACLSGGIDSSSLVCVVNDLMKKEKIKQIGAKQKVFTACYHNSEIDESHWAKKVVDATQTEWYQVFPTAQEMLADLEDLVYTQDVPFYGSSTYSQYKVMHKASEAGVKVTLDGQGADELFAGYSSHFIMYMKECLKRSAYKEFFSNFLNADNAFASRKRLFIELFKPLVVNNKIPFLKINTDDQDYHKELSYLRQRFVKSAKEQAEKQIKQQSKKKKQVAEKQTQSVNLNELLHRQFSTYMLKSLLRTGDRNAMRFSVESRMPFADDKDLIEYVFNIPANYKIKKGQGKMLLRGAMRGLLPEEIRQRRDKLGFATPEAEWLFQLKDELKQYITDDLDEYLHVRRLRQDWDMLFEHASQHGTTRLWRIINFAVWKKVFGL